MRKSLPSRLKRPGLLLVLLAAAFTTEALANVGRVDFVIGDVTAVSSGGQRRALTRGEELSNGDTIITNNGRAQIRFADGAYVSLQPNTEFGIKDYRYEGKTDGSERGFFSLLKGGLRTVTGLIGRFNRKTYQITTPTATVGIRGTGGLIQVLNDSSTVISGSSGIWLLSSPAGSVEVPAGTSAIAPANPDIPPHQTNEGPNLPPPPPGGLNNDFRQGDQVNPDGTPASLSTVAPPAVVSLKSGGGYAVATAFSDGSWGNVASGEDATAVFNPSGQLTDVSFAEQIYSAKSKFTLQPGGSHAEFGTDGILAWGRWVGPASIQYSCDGSYTCNADLTYGANDGLHYVIGLPTPALPTSGSASYSLLGATSPTYAGGSTAPGTFSGKLDVTFLATGATVGMNLNVSMPDGVGYAIGGSTSTNPGSSLFNGNAYNSGGVQSGSLTITGTGGGACTSSGYCSANVQGFFAGASAQRAGLGYTISDYESTVVGAAAFKKQ